LEKSLKALFTKVHREKPASSRTVSAWFPQHDGGRSLQEQESKESYFVAVKRKRDVERASVLG
jgi:hypothetical protein